MGLQIRTTDNEKEFNIGYIGFAIMRQFFVLPYSKESYNEYKRMFLRIDFEPDLDQYGGVDDLDILLYHADSDGELTHSECKKLLPCLKIDEEAIKKTENYENNPEHTERMINKMYEFRELVSYCAEHEDMKLIFG